VTSNNPFNSCADLPHDEDSVALYRQCWNVLISGLSIHSKYMG